MLHLSAQIGHESVCLYISCRSCHLSVRFRLPSGILLAVLSCRSPLRLQQTDKPSADHQAKTTRNPMTDYGITNNIKESLGTSGSSFQCSFPIPNLLRNISQRVGNLTAHLFGPFENNRFMRLQVGVVIRSCHLLRAECQAS